MMMGMNISHHLQRRVFLHYNSVVEVREAILIWLIRVAHGNLGLKERERESERRAE
jgi:hypothetical protein